MKKAMSFGVTLSLFFVLLVSYTFAQDYTQWGLPEGAKARLGKGNITGNIAYSPDGTRLAVASSIGIWLYDTGSYQEVALLTRHSSYQARYTGDVASVAFSPDGLTLASGGVTGDHTVRLWDAVTGAHKAALTGHGNSVISVAFSPDGLTLASSVTTASMGRSDRRAQSDPDRAGCQKHSI